MQLIHYGMEGQITVNGRCYPMQHFLKFLPNYSVPFGFHTRIYKRESAHYITDGANTLYLPKVCPYCDDICEREGELARLSVRLQAEENGR